MENQLAQLDNLVDKDPKKALGMLGNFADAINDRSNANDNMVCFYLKYLQIYSKSNNILEDLEFFLEYFLILLFWFVIM